MHLFLWLLFSNWGTMSIFYNLRIFLFFYVEDNILCSHCIIAVNIMSTNTLSGLNAFSFTIICLQASSVSWEISSYPLSSSWGLSSFLISLALLLIPKLLKVSFPHFHCYFRFLCLCSLFCLNYTWHFCCFFRHSVKHFHVNFHIFLLLCVNSSHEFFFIPILLKFPFYILIVLCDFFMSLLAPLPPIFFSLSPNSLFSHFTN